MDGDDASGQAPVTWSFGPYRLDLGGRRLTDDGRPVSIGGRALDLLIALMERPGELVTKAELIARAWPDTHVDDANLRVQISAIRRALGDKTGAYIAAESGRGYRFVAPLENQSIGQARRERRRPVSLTQPIGREADIAAISERFASARLLTIVGPGGIGKTTLAQACANVLEARFADGVVFAEVTSGGGSAMAVANALGLRLSENTVIEALVSFAAPLELLVLLDSCEYAVEPSAELVEAILRGSPKTVVLCTSREPLRAEGEVAWRIEPLAMPAEDQQLSAEEALTYPAVRLFVDRASAADQRFKLTDSDVGAVCSLCRRLDGLPLAIELAAGRMAALGLSDLVVALDNRFQLLLQGRRTAMPRHRTMAAAIDWSYDQLSEDEQRGLRRLSLFQGPFDGDDATYLALGHTEIDPLCDVLSNLVAKSLVMADFGRKPTEYRLLDSTRDYARLKLEAAGELNAVAARHVARAVDIFKRADSELEARSMEDWLNYYSRRLQDARAALNWTYAPGGDRSYAVRLTLAATPVWMRLARYAECWRWLEAATAVVERGSADEMALDIAVGYVAQAANFGRMETVVEASKRAIYLAGRLHDPASQLRATWTLWNVYINCGRIRLAHENAVRLLELADSVGGPFERLVADRAIGVTELVLGNLTAARAAIERVRMMSPDWHARERLKWYAYDPDIMAHITLVSLLWLEGKPEAAIAVAEEISPRALVTGAENAAPAFLTDAACSLAIMMGDEGAADRYLTHLDAYVRRGAPPGFGTWAKIARATLAAGRADIEPGLALMDGGFDIRVVHPRTVPILGELAEKLGTGGAVEAAQRLADGLLQRVENHAEYWFLSEVQRIRAQLTADEGEARSLLDFALETARAQGARAWELRAATSLARRWPQTAGEILAPLIDSFAEGHGTRDLVAARQVLGRV